MVEKDIRVLFVRRYDFINDKTGENVKGIKASYCFTSMIDKDNEKGFKVLVDNLPYEKFKEITSKLPYECVGIFEVNDKAELKLRDVKSH